MQIYTHRYIHIYIYEYIHICTCIHILTCTYVHITKLMHMIHIYTEIFFSPKHEILALIFFVRLFFKSGFCREKIFYL